MLHVAVTRARQLRRCPSPPSISNRSPISWEVRTTLQRLVQVLKWHCMRRFATDPDNQPPSILITTLAARAYRGEVDLFTATRNALAGMGDFIENRQGRWWVPNPAHEEENFADKWNEEPDVMDEKAAGRGSVATRTRDSSSHPARMASSAASPPGQVRLLPPCSRPSPSTAQNVP